MAMVILIGFACRRRLRSVVECFSILFISFLFFRNLRVAICIIFKEWCAEECVENIICCGLPLIYGYEQLPFKWC